MLQPAFVVTMLFLLHVGGLAYLSLQKHQTAGVDFITANLGSDLAEVQAALLFVWFVLSPAALWVRAAVFLPLLVALWSLCVFVLFPEIKAYITCGFVFHLGLLAVPLITWRLFGKRLVADQAPVPPRQFSMRQILVLFAEIGGALWIAMHPPHDLSVLNVDQGGFSIGFDDLANVILITALVGLLLIGNLATGLALSVLSLAGMCLLAIGNNLGWKWREIFEMSADSWPNIHYTYVLFAAEFLTILSLRLGGFRLKNLDPPSEIEVDVFTSNVLSNSA